MSWLVRLTFADPDRARHRAELISSRLWDLGTTGVAEVDDGRGFELVAGFENRSEADRAAAAFADLRSATVEPAPGLDHWIDPDESNSVELSPGRFITIVPGAAFGHGSHPSTRLALDLLAGHADRASNALDIGSGTGVLSLAALTMNPDLQLTAIDIDPVAVGQTSHNLEQAGVQQRATVIEGPIDSVKADSGPYDLVMVNVLLHVHRSVGPHLDRLVTDHPMVLASGFLIEQAPELLAVYSRYTVVEQRELGPWAALALTIPPGQPGP